MGKSVAVAVGCYPFAFQWHFNGNSTAQEKLNIYRWFWCFYPHQSRESESFWTDILPIIPNYNFTCHYNVIEYAKQIHDILCQELIKAKDFVTSMKKKKT